MVGQECTHSVELTKIDPHDILTTYHTVNHLNMPLEFLNLQFLPN